MAKGISVPTLYADIIGQWTRNSRFLDSTGSPRALKIHGKDGFKRLVREVSPNSNYSEVLSTLIRFGNVRRSNRDKYMLMKRFFHTCTPSNVAFEPSAYFLSDASSTLAKILTRTKHSRNPEGFWRKAEKATMSSTVAKKFAAFSRERTQIFLEEIDDWLEAHSKIVKRNKKGSYQRIGLGVFTVFSKPDPYQTRR